MNFVSLWKPEIGLKVLLTYFWPQNEKNDFDLLKNFPNIFMKIFHIIFMKTLIFFHELFPCKSSKPLPW